MKDVIALNLHNEKIKNEKEGTKDKVVEKTLARQEEATKVIENDFLR
jgi:myo-inositol-1-phosphate synthase